MTFSTKAILPWSSGPAKIVLGTAVLAGAVSLDGDGSTTYIITTSAMLPLYLRLGMSPVVLTCVAGLINGTMNILPWGGPTVRAAAALGLEPSEVFVPMIPRSSPVSSSASVSPGCWASQSASASARSVFRSLPVTRSPTRPPWPAPC